ncbi:MAG TPA: anthranilate synthase component I [Pyrinomonadaceae bacterium]|nr:anthranilate synthase component I [Pyrinomonadaceae bacterium]
MIEISPKTFEEFQAETSKGNVVPVVRSVLADLHTPVGAFLRVANDAEQAFLLESIEGGERLARYSFLAANPFMTVRSHKSQTILEKDGSRKLYPDRTLVEFLRNHFRRHRLARREKLPPLCGGAVGFLAYDAARWFEKVLDDGEKRDKTDAIWMFFRNILVFDRLKQRIEIVSIVFTDEAKDDEARLKKLYDEAVEETARLEKLLAESSLPAVTSEKREKAESNQFSSNWKKADFLEAVEKIKDHILAGDAYQVVLSQKFKRQTSAEPINIYRALRTTNPSPYMFYVKLGAETLIGASPEMLVRCSGKKLEYRPIAGTRKRGATETEDWILAEDLRSDMKEISEHVMLVDLGRNDLGRVSEFGSVEVAELMKIEKYSHVQHLVTSLKSRLKDGLDRFDALGACFPAGTVSGAPKVRAMQIIDELEPSKRGVYAGAIGYIDYAENLDTCIAIRTIRLTGGTASIQAGAGIVADSVPEKEYEETINKARALVKAIEMAENFDT